jgi:ribosomal protein L29
MKNKVNYSELTPQDLQNRLGEFSEELYAARQKMRVGQFKKISEFTRLRREIARIKTHITAQVKKKA